MTGKVGTLTQQYRKAVLVVDDDPSMLKGMRRLLTHHGYEAVPFETAKALREHCDFDQAFCIVLPLVIALIVGSALRAGERPDRTL